MSDCSIKNDNIEEARYMHWQLKPRKCTIYKIQKHFQNVMLVGMASENSKNYTYKCVDRSRHNGIKGAKAKCAH